MQLCMENYCTCSPITVHTLQPYVYNTLFLHQSNFMKVKSTTTVQLYCKDTTRTRRDKLFNNIILLIALVLSYLRRYVYMCTRPCTCTRTVQRRPKRFRVRVRYGSTFVLSYFRTKVPSYESTSVQRCTTLYTYT